MSDQDKIKDKTELQENESESSCFSSLANQPLAPFEIFRVMGFDWSVGVKLVEEKGDLILIYGMGHLISLVNIETLESETITTHRKNIVQIDQDLSGRFIITCDIENAIIWDRKCSETNSKTILRIFHKPFGNLSIHVVAISTYGRYAILVSEPNNSDEYQIQFWLWSFGRIQCDDESTISKEYGKIKSIRFSEAPEEEEYFVITMSHAAIFGCLDSENVQLKFYYPETKRFNELNSSCYVRFTRLVVSGTSRGRLIVWSDLHYEILKKPVTNDKRLVKSVPLRNCSINDVRMVDQFITIVDNCGEIRFYDSEIRLIFYCNSWNISPIYCISSHPSPRQYKLVDDEYFESEIEEENIEVINMSTCPKDCTLEAKPFIVRNFVIMTKDGQIYYCDIVKNTCKSLLYHCEDQFIVSDHHPSDSLIATGSASGRLVYFDYKRHWKISEYTLKNIDGVVQPDTVWPKCTCLRMSPTGIDMALGFNNGLLCLVEVVTGKLLTPKPLRFTTAPIEKIIFGNSLNKIIFADSNFTVIFLQLVDETWSFVAKVRYHCLPIVGLFITHFDRIMLITIAEDRMLAEYNIRKSINNRKMVLTQDIRLEQSAKITAAELLPVSILKRDLSDRGHVILTANNEYKFRVYDAYSFECILTVLGPLFESPIRHIIINTETSYSIHPILIVASKKMLCSVVTPLDGNPFRISGTTVHHKQIKNISSAKNGLHISVQGVGDFGASIWTLNERHAIINFESGGQGLEPFCSLLPGGKGGWLFNEMQDFFYYLQLISESHDSTQQHVIRDAIELSDMVDYMRAIGYFPSEWEIKIMRTEVKRYSGSTSLVQAKISFSDLVKLYLNHKPVDGYKLIDIISAVQHVAKYSSTENLDENKSSDEDNSTADLIRTDKDYNAVKISMNQIVDLLTEKAEAIPKEQAMKYIFELLDTDKPKQQEDDELDEGESHISKLPQSLDIWNFCKLLLGIDIASTIDDRDVFHSVFGDVVNPAEIEPKLDNKAHYTPIMERCLQGGDRFEQKEEESEEEEETEEEMSENDSTISSMT